MLEPARRNLSLSATGDTLINQPLAIFDEPEFLALRRVIHQTNVRFTNLETIVHDYVGSPAAESGGTWLAAAPSLLGDLQWYSFNLFAWAHNHALDYGPEALKATYAHLTQAGLTHAGSGHHLSDARRAKYLNLREGRVALISVTSTFPAGAQATHPTRALPGRPGVNPLRFETEVSLPEHEYRLLNDIATDTHLNAKEKLRTQLGFSQPEVAERLNLGGVSFRSGPTRTTRTTCHQGDLEDNLAAIRDATLQADWVIVSIHAHELGQGSLFEPPEFLRDFAHACVEAGAHAVLGHGPHTLRGLEFHRGVPVFYSLGNFIFQNELVELQPFEQYEKARISEHQGTGTLFDARSRGGTAGFALEEHYWQTVVPVLRWEGGALAQVTIHPVALGFGLPRSMRGRPVLATGDEGQRILQRFEQLSRPFGTEFTWSQTELPSHAGLHVTLEVNLHA